MEAQLQALGTGPLYPFSSWKRDAGVPQIAAGVYTIWWSAEHPPMHASGFAYVGIAGRKGTTAAWIEEQRRSGAEPWGLWKRLEAHASGQRGADKFALYVFDRIILPTLSAEDICAVAAGKLSLDRRVKDYVREHLGFRRIETPDYESALKVETVLRRGQWEHGKPFLNPG